MKSKRQVVLFFIIMGLIITLGGIKAITEACESLSWPHTEGIIIKSEWGSRRNLKGPSTRFADIEYEFEVKGEKYKGSQISLKDLTVSSEELLQTYSVGKKVTVYYNPDDPSYSLLEPGISNKTYVAFIIGVIMLLIGTGIAIFYKPKERI